MNDATRTPGTVDADADADDGPGVGSRGAEGPTSSSEPGAPGLIGVEDVDPPYWAQFDGSVASASSAAMLRAVPRILAVIARRAWAVAPVWTVLAVLVHVAEGIVTAFGLLATADVFTELLAQGPTPQRLLSSLPALGLVAGAYAAGGLLEAASGLVTATLAPRVETQAQGELLAAVIGVDLVAFDDADFVELTNRAASTGINQLRMSTTFAGDLLSSLVSMAAAMVTAAALHPLLAPAVLFSALPQGWATIRSAKITYRSFLETSARVRRLHITADLGTNRADAAEVRAFTAQDTLLGEHQRIAADLTAQAVAVEYTTARVRLAGRTLAGLGAAAAYLVLGTLIYASALPLALAGAAALALRTSSGAVSRSVYAANRLYESSFYLDLYHRCLRDAAHHTRTPTTSSPAGPTIAGGPDANGSTASTATVPAGTADTGSAAVAAVATSGPSVVELDDVTFTYPGQDRPALCGISLTLRAGQVVALVGENGSGKSTLAKLLTGLYLPERGTVRWDGVDIRTIDPRELHRHVAVVMQNPTEWPMTAANNVRIGRLEYADPDGQRLHNAVQRSGADTVIAGLPQGYDTVLSRVFRSGRDLSGGQWQRLSVARGLYRHAALVVADEPTAAMDARAEHAVFTHLHGLGATPTTATQEDTGADEADTVARRPITVLVTHRLANVRHADLIVVLDDGHLTEHGTHEDLMAHPAGYAELFTLQARAYHEDGTQCG